MTCRRLVSGAEQFLPSTVKCKKCKGGTQIPKILRLGYVINEAMLCTYEKFFDLLFTTWRLRRRGMRLCTQVLPVIAGKFSLLSGTNHKKKDGKGSSTFCCIGDDTPGPSRREEGAGTAAGKRGRAGDGEMQGVLHTVLRPIGHT